jgi:hypothetical protein
MRFRWLVALLLAAAPAEAAPEAFEKGDARAVTARLETEWKNAGAKTTTLPTRFVFDEETVLVPIPVGPASECIEIALIGARGLSFRARLSDAPTDPMLPPEPNARAASAAGMLALRRCEKDKPITHVVVTAEAGRGAVEIVVGRSDKPLPALASLLPERAGGAVPPPPEAGALPPLATPDARADAAEARAKREGAQNGGRAKTRAGDEGSGEEEIELEAGCHRLEVFGKELTRERPGRRFRLDVDAELRDSERVITRDRTEAPDARLETCVGETSRVTLAYIGSPPHSEVIITRASWPLPAKLPGIWGPVTKSHMARALFLRHVTTPPDDAVFLTQGSTGATPIPLPMVETGACYVAIAGVARGHPRQLQLRTVIGARESTDERGAAEEAALSAFCVRANESARVEVLSRGTGVSWGLALFRIQSGDWEQGR